MSNSSYLLELNSMIDDIDNLPLEKEKLPATARRHRLQLLRAWLLHFVSSVDNYIMECVLESSHIRLDLQLENAIHLGQIIDRLLIIIIENNLFIIKFEMLLIDI